MSQTFNILLVEDHVADVLLAKKAFAKLALPVMLHVALDGFEALAFLRKEGRFVGAVRPNLILLDLNMPRKDGWAVLKEAKADPVFRLIPIIILTSSSAGHDVTASYANYANGYVAKPVSFDAFEKAIEKLAHFWLNTAIVL